MLVDAQPRPRITSSPVSATHQKGSPAGEWHKPTTCLGWSVKDVALHLLGVDVGNLSRRRDGHQLPASASGRDDLVALINDWNQSWAKLLGASVLHS